MTEALPLLRKFIVYLPSILQIGRFLETYNQYFDDISVYEPHTKKSNQSFL